LAEPTPSPAARPPAAPFPVPFTAPTPALWRDLLRRLLLPLLLIVAATGALGLYTAQTLTDHTFDRWLLDTARALARQVRVVDGQAVVDLGHNAEAILSYDVVDSSYFSVRQQQRHVAGHAGMPQSGRQEARYNDGRVFDAAFAGQPVRVAEVTVGSGASQVQVTVAETLVKRGGVRADLQLMLLPLGLLLLAAAGAIVLALRWTLLPLERIATRWNERSHRSLQTIDVQGVPRELLPFASALNDLLVRIHQLLLRERRFAANAAHQIRTPLAGLQLGLSRAAAAPDLASAQAVIAELQGSTQRTARLLQQLLALGRLDPETAFDLDCQPVDLVALAHDVGALYLDAALARQIDLELVAPEHPVMASVQAELVSEALANLVDNALRYVPPGARVEISVRDHPPSLAVADSGPGLAADERVAVLERFVRGRGASGDGSGLGLAIVREITDLHHAGLQLDTSALGGLVVRLSFAADAAPPAANAPALRD
jgi:two-component system sensor histidine kinase TctE